MRERLHQIDKQITKIRNLDLSASNRLGADTLRWDVAYT